LQLHPPPAPPVKGGEFSSPDELQVYRVIENRNQSWDFLALKSWQWMPELANTTMDGYWRDLKPKALQP
jgi:hypothetical protein